MKNKNTETITQTLRKQRIKGLVKLISENKDVDKRKLLALFCFRTGTTMRKAKEYYEVVELSGVIND